MDIVRSNVMWLAEQSLPRDRFDTRSDDGCEKIVFRFEGALFGSSGIAQVRPWAELAAELSPRLCHAHYC
jgi:hypothetical protein